MIGGSCFIAVALAEGALALLSFAPSQLLIPARNHDDVLVYRLPKGWPDADARGFRNASVPAKVDLVAFGDSHTYGYNVEAPSSWPSLVAKTSSSTVYNFGMGGFGPLQAYKLLDEALCMNPKAIVLALYLQNDLADICEAYHQAEWWRSPEGKQLVDLGFCDSITVKPGPLSFLRPIRKGAQDFISSLRLASLVRTALYKCELNEPAVGERWVVADLAAHRFEMNKDRFAAVLEATDLSKSKTQKSFELVVELLVRMAMDCSRAGVGLGVLFVPSRELVFARALERAGQPVPELIRRVADLESRLELELVPELDQLGVPWAKAEPRLVELLESSDLLYPPRDSHPFANGYRAYARTVTDDLLPALGAKTQTSTEARSCVH